MSDFRFAVVGRGLTGAAAARHLAEQGHSVVLVGPDEPADSATHDGVFASHYDEGRITRTIDPNENWARFANRSIARYRDIEVRSGISFYGEKGCLISGLTTGRSQRYMADIKAAAARLGVETRALDDAALARDFPYFSFPSNSDAVFEPKGAGHISPRRLVAAQSLLAEKAGARILRDHAVSIRDETGSASIELSRGERVSAERVLVAAGGFSNRPGLLPDPLDLRVYGRTVTLFEVDEAEARRLEDMPSMIYEPEEEAIGVYLLPPIRYPDGRIYLKLGGDTEDILLPTEEDVRAWFKSEGARANGTRLTETMKALVPGLQIRSTTDVTCVTSYTPTGYPAIGWTSSPQIAVMAGGCGGAAKSSDEIGRLGSELLVHGVITDPVYSADFKPRFL